MTETANIFPIHSTSSSSESPAPYLSQLGLNQDPFSNEFQQEFFLLDSDRAQRLNMLFHLVQDSELLLLVTGIQGSGKTSLLNRFLDMGNDRWRTCIIDANAMMNPDQLLTQIAEGFGLPQDSVNFNTVFEILNKRLTEMKIGELMPILIIDDAHELPAASLTILMKLSELADHDDRLLRIVLFSEPQINTILNSQELHEVRHRITHTLDLPKLSEEQTRDYINFRMSIAGLKNEIPFTRSQIVKIFRLSDGIPGRINLHAHEILLTMQHGVNSQSDVSLPVRLRAAFSIVVILSIAGSVTWFLARDSISSLTTENLSTETIASEPKAVIANGKITLPLLPPDELALNERPDSAITPSTTKEKIDKNLNTELTATTELEAELPAPIATAKVKPIATPTVPEPTIDKIETTLPVIQETKKVSPKIATPVEKPLPTIDKKTTATPAIKKIVEKVTTTTETKEVAAKTEPTAKIKPTVKKNPITTPAATTANWLAKQNPKHFTLQLMGSRSKTAVSKLLRASKLDNRANIIRTQLKNDDWFILVYNHYPTIEQARAAIRTLPKVIQKSKPWPRQISGINVSK